MAKTPTKPTASKAAPAKAAKPTTPAPAKTAKSKASPPPPPPPPVPEKVRTVTINQMAVAYAEKHELSRNDALSVLSEVFDTVVQHVKDGDKVRIAGLGVIEVRSRAARMGRNPATGEAIQIAASRKIAFRAAKELKEAI